MEIAKFLMQSLSTRSREQGAQWVVAGLFASAPESKQERAFALKQAKPLITTASFPQVTLVVGASHSQAFLDHKGFSTATNMP